MASSSRLEDCLWAKSLSNTAVSLSSQAGAVSGFDVATFWRVGFSLRRASVALLLHLALRRLVLKNGLFASSCHSRFRQRPPTASPGVFPCHVTRIHRLEQRPASVPWPSSLWRRSRPSIFNGWRIYAPQIYCFGRCEGCCEGQGLSMCAVISQGSGLLEPLFSSSKMSSLDSEGGRQGAGLS